MNATLAIVFPGQGSQSIGMLSGLAAEHSLVVETFDLASDVLGYDLWQLVQEGPENDLNETDKTQPAMLAAGVAVWRVWQDAGGPVPALMAGHSLGEYTALVCAGALDFQEAVVLVEERGRCMQSAVPAGSGAMAAILGLDDVAVSVV
jgi:[acyl-carrier-protein] S-malonyltransferase